MTSTAPEIAISTDAPTSVAVRPTRRSSQLVESDESAPVTSATESVAPTSDGDRPRSLSAIAKTTANAPYAKLRSERASVEMTSAR